MPETPRTWTLTQDVKHVRFGVASGPSLGRDEAVEVIEKAPVGAEIEQLTDALERHKRLVARYRKPMPEGGLTSSEKLHTSHVARVDAEARAEQVEAERERMLDLLARVDEYLRVPDYVSHDDLMEARQVEADLVALLREHGRLPKEVE